MKAAIVLMLVLAVLLEELAPTVANHGGVRIVVVKLKKKQKIIEKLHCVEKEATTEAPAEATEAAATTAAAEATEAATTTAAAEATETAATTATPYPTTTAAATTTEAVTTTEATTTTTEAPAAPYGYS